MDTHDAAPAAAKTPKDAPTIWRVDDALWAELRPLLVVDKPRKKPGRPRRDDRTIFDGLIWLTRNGGQWATPPREFGPKSIVHDRFRKWIAHGCFDAAWARRLVVHDGAVGIDGQWRAADECIVKAPLGNKGGRRDGGDRAQPRRAGQVRLQTAPADRGAGRPHRRCAVGGQPHRHEEAGRPAGRHRGRGATAAAGRGRGAGGRELCLARGYADDECRAAAAERGDRAHIPPARRQGHPLPPPGHPDRHPPRRRVVEVAHSWFDRFRHLLIRWDKRADHYLAYVHLAACLIVYREIRHARTLSG